MNAALAAELAELAQAADNADRDRLAAIGEAFPDANGVAGLPGPARDFCNDLRDEADPSA